MKAEMAAEEVRALFIVEVYIGRLSVDESVLQRPLHRPALSVQLLNYQPLLLESSRKEDDFGGENSEYGLTRLVFPEGASALFAEQTKAFVDALKAAPLYIMLLDVPESKKTLKGGNSLFHVASTALDLRGWKNNTTRLHGYVPLNLHDLFGCSVGTGILHLSIASLGTEILRHLNPNELAISETPLQTHVRLTRDSIFHSGTVREVHLNSNQDDVDIKEPITSKLDPTPTTMFPSTNQIDYTTLRAPSPDYKAGSPELVIYRVESSKLIPAHQLTRVDYNLSALSSGRKRAPKRTKTFPPPLIFQKSHASEQSHVNVPQEHHQQQLISPNQCPPHYVKGEKRDPKIKPGVNKSIPNAIICNSEKKIVHASGKLEKMLFSQPSYMFNNDYFY